MAVKRRPEPETRRAIVQATVELLEEEGAAGLSVSGIMRRAGISRTAFYRSFDGAHEVVAEILRGVAAELLANAGEWLTDPGVVGSPEVVYPNLLGYARVFHARGRLLSALNDARVLDERVRSLWDELVSSFRDVIEAAIERDQAAGAVRAELDAEAVATALTLMGERVSVQLFGREPCSQPETYAEMLAPVWIGTLFGEVPPGS